MIGMEAWQAPRRRQIHIVTCRTPSLNFLNALQSAQSAPAVSGLPGCDFAASSVLASQTSDSKSLR